MRIQELYNAAQWKWIRARYDEGYSVLQLSTFLGVRHESLRRLLPYAERLPLRGWSKKKGLTPLDERKAEFNKFLSDELARR